MDRRVPILALAILTASVTVSFAQEAGEPETLDELIDFVIRPTQPIVDEEDIWNWDTEADESLLDAEIGPPLAGPTGEETIGPPLAGPSPEPIEDGRIRPRREPLVDPYAAQGINLGSFIIRPSIEIGGLATDNVAGSADKEAAIGLVLAPELILSGETERYDFEAIGRAETITYEDEQFNEQTAEARGRLRYALTSATDLHAEFGYARFLEDFSDPDTPAGAAERPAVHEFDGSLGVEHRIGRLSTRFTGFADREIHDEVPLTGGGVADQSELNNTEFGVRSRAGYATSSVLRPFVDAAVGSRLFDNAEDDSGFARSSVWGELSGGLVIDRGEKLSGEVSIGYRHEDIEDDRLEDLNIFLANAAILWSPRRLTEVRLDLSTDVDSTDTPGASASVIYAGSLVISRSFTPRVRGETGVGVSHESEIGSDSRDVTFTGFAGASYAFNRVASLIARYEYERTDRNEVDGKFDTHEVSLRLRLQR